MPDPNEGGLADIFAALSECPTPPPPTPPVRDGYDLSLMVPDPTMSTLESAWLPNDIISLEVRPGTVNAPGGGSCGLWRGQSHRGGSVSEWTEWQGSHAQCVAVTEPGFTVGLILGLLVVTALRLLSDSRRQRRASPSDPAARRGDSGASLGAGLLRAPRAPRP